MAHSHHADCCGVDHHHSHTVEIHPVKEKTELVKHWDLLLALAILIFMLVAEYVFQLKPQPGFSLLIFGVAWFLAGRDVFGMAFRKIGHGDVFNEFVLMTVATLGAFLLGEYSEGVAVMVFYSIGEWFQDIAVSGAKQNIKNLMDGRPDEVNVWRDEKFVRIAAANASLNELVQVKSGEKVGLDGILVSNSASFNTAALTGESKPDTRYKDDVVLAGMVNLNSVATFKVTALYKDSKLSKVLEMVQDAAGRKSKTQLLISQLAKVYTPVVFFLAAAVCLLPYFFVNDYNFHEWFYRALVFLVISCPCALVVSIPLGYFGGIGLASRNGILVKGGNFLDALAKTNTVVFDKTGTLTKGVFKVKDVHFMNGPDRYLLELLSSLELNSAHPVAKAVVEYAGVSGKYSVSSVEERSGGGIKGIVDGKLVVAGTLKMLTAEGVELPFNLQEINETLIAMAVDGIYVGYLTIGDELKPDAKSAVDELQGRKIKVAMLSGDRQATVSRVAAELDLKLAFGELLPGDKIDRFKELKSENATVAFVGDGFNDAPVLALADVGIAMGGLGSDAAIETADVIIQNDEPLKVIAAIKVARLTRNIVWQNIIMAFLVKAAVLILGAKGIANLWEAVIADVGVALLAILNAIRIQRKKIK